jgi:hypothetical protein
LSQPVSVAGRHLDQSKLSDRRSNADFQFAQDRDGPSTSATHSVLFLDWQNDGQSFGADMGDQIEIRLGAMVPRTADLISGGSPRERCS